MSDSKKKTELETATPHRQKRALITRQELIRSARYVFACDGFEHARIEDIACRAGKTRGAFYANFKDKEDVFCAIFEENIDRDLASLSELLSGLDTKSQRIEAFCSYLSRLSRDRQRTLLNLEFKLYAIRHPRKRKRLANLHAIMRLRCAMPEFKELKSVHKSISENDQLNDEQSIGSLAIGGVMDGLALNHLFDPEALTQKELGRYLRICVEEALHV